MRNIILYVWEDMPQSMGEEYDTLYNIRGSKVICIRITCKEQYNKDWNEKEKMIINNKVSKSFWSPISLLRGKIV